MSLAATLLTIGLQAASEPPLPLPRSFSEAQLAACAPQSLDAAVSCLRRGLSPEDLAIVRDRIPARRFRPGLDEAVERAWHLRDPAAPMARVMRGLLGLDRPRMAAGLLISELQVRMTDPSGSGLDFKEIAKALRDDPPPPEKVSSETTSPQEKPHAD